MDEEPLITPAEAARIADVTVDALRQARIRGSLKPAKTEMRGRKPEHYYRKTDILARWPAREPNEDSTV